MPFVRIAPLPTLANTGQNTEITRCHALLNENHIPLPKPLPTSLPFALTDGAKGGEGGRSARGSGGDNRASGGLTSSASVGTIGGLRADEAEWAASLKVGQRMLAESVGALTPPSSSQPLPPHHSLFLTLQASPHHLCAEVLSLSPPLSPSLPLSLWLSLSFKPIPMPRSHFSHPLPSLPATRPTRPTRSTCPGVHPGVACDRSGQCPIIGYRYALKGKDYDLCEEEFDKLRTDEKAAYTKLVPPVKWKPSLALAREVAAARRKPSYIKSPKAERAAERAATRAVERDGEGAAGSDEVDDGEDINSNFTATGSGADGGGATRGDDGAAASGQRFSLEGRMLEEVMHAPREELARLMQRVSTPRHNSMPCTLLIASLPPCHSATLPLSLPPYPVLRFRLLLSTYYSPGDRR